MPTSIHIGLSDQQRDQISSDLKLLLADTYTIYLKTHNYHWNVEGPLFSTLHKLFEEQYTELAVAVDDLAERIRALGHYAPATYQQFSELTSIQEDTDIPDWRKMVEQLVQDHEAVIRTARKGLEPADSANDQPTLDLITQRMYTHEKTAWMLRSLLAGKVE